MTSVPEPELAKKTKEVKERGEFVVDGVGRCR